MVNNSYYMGSKWNKIDSYNFPSIIFNGGSTTNTGCLAAEYHPNYDKLVVVPVDCKQPGGIICRTHNYFHVQTCNKERMNLNRLDILLNPNKQESKNFAINKGKKVALDMFERLDQAHAFHALLSTLWYASLPCYDIKNVTAQKSGERAVIKYCEWKGVPISCAAIFSPYPTDQGMCCSFNMKAADEIYYAGPYSDIITDLQDANNAKSFDDCKKPKWYLEAAEPTSLPGHNRGLFLIIDAHMDQFTSTSQPNDFDGFIGLINPSGSFPLMSLEGFQIKPGNLNDISIAGTMVYADDDMKDMDINDRKCMFKNDNAGMIIHKEYTYSNCMLECQLLYSRYMVRTFH